MSLSIFNYEDPSQYLRDAWNQKRVANSRFTLRAWANHLGISSHGTFYQMVMGKRPLPKKYIKPLAKSLNLNQKEALYLETLVDFSKAKTMEHKSYYKDRLQNIAPGERLKFHEIETFHYLKNPLNCAIIELTTIKDFKNDIEWIQKRLWIKATLSEIQKSIQLMLDLKLLELDENGKYKRVHSHIYTSQDVKNEALQEYHKGIKELACKALEEQDLKDREFNASCFNVLMSNVPEMKEDLRNFMNEFIKKYEAKVGEGEELYQLSMQLFTLTDTKKYH